jgi:hypothetical protein
MFFPLKTMAIMATCCLFIQMNVKKSIWLNFKFRFWFKAFEGVHLLHQKESILQKAIKRTHTIKAFWWEKN